MTYEDWVIVFLDNECFVMNWLELDEDKSKKKEKEIWLHGFFRGEEQWFTAAREILT